MSSRGGGAPAIREGVTRNLFCNNTVFCITSLSYMPRHCCRVIMDIGIPHAKNFVKRCPAKNVKKAWFVAIKPGQYALWEKHYKGCGATLVLEPVQKPCEMQASAVIRSRALPATETWDGGVAGVPTALSVLLRTSGPGRTQSCVHPWTLGVRPQNHAPHGFVPLRGIAEGEDRSEGGDFPLFAVLPLKGELLTSSAVVHRNKI
jgi:hypothetical protein